MLDNTGVAEKNTNQTIFPELFLKDNYTMNET